MNNVITKIFNLTNKIDSSLSIVLLEEGMKTID